jgi:putative copper export protein/mono/diheme cytochrome c family protein
LAWTSLLVAIATGTAWLFVEASSVSGQPIATVLPSGVVTIVLTQTQFGQAWALRGALAIVLAIVLAVFLLVRGRGRKLAGWTGLVASVGLMVSLAWAGHAAATEGVPWEWLHLPADLLHLFATGAWLGALVPLALLLAHVRSDAGAGALSVARAATLRFSTLGIICVATLTVTGIVNTWFLSGSIPALVGTLYGQLLLLKVALFVGIIALADVNRRRLVPELASATSDAALRLRAVGKVSRNAFSEAGVGVLVIAIVGIMGILPPGLHTEPRWPFPFQIDLNEIAIRMQKVLDVVAGLFVLCLIASAIAADRKRYRVMAASVVGVVLCGGVGAIALAPGIEPAYPTTYYTPTQAYAAPSISRGMPLYAANCTQCHGIEGRGDGPLAASLPIRPADLTEPHLFAHKVGDIFWWVSNGRANGVMPGFASKLTPDQRWDLINFVLARTAGILTDATGSQISTAAAPPLPDFAFEQQGAQNTLLQSLKNGPALLVLFSSQAPLARLERLQAAGVHAIAVDMAPAAKTALAVGVSDDVRAALALFRSPKDGGETELLLDRNAGVRARWTAGEAGGLPDAATLQADTERVARIPVAAPNHAGHAH